MGDWQLILLYFCDGLAVNFGASISCNLNSRSDFFSLFLLLSVCQKHECIIQKNKMYMDTISCFSKAEKNFLVLSFARASNI